ncbi:Hsp33 family molecular chaperone HslO [Hahella sp. HN01]|uniref:Hsp33 family molecular chaperone HslO n=1 Tax=Hahella sp. HN01 TaxID=2847262 RepID=UPI001C1F17E6|nr:Hsp33 family molecular chaperone HslO [Hahella sp. HN01]MBU6954148.1 Hsp33 family molecular chaperone HslO [Hahella sp. HN01]
MKADLLQRFIFDELDIRGELLVLEKTIQDALSRHDYPQAIQSLLGQALSAGLLLSATLKIKGDTTLQATGEGELRLLMAEATHRRTARGIARWEGTPNSASLKQLLGNRAALAITITPQNGQRYQGIVPLSSDSLSACLEEYFERSEQLATRIWLYESNGRWGGLLLQQLPAARGGEHSAENWERIVALSATLTADELFSLPAEEVLHRLFHEESVRVLQEEPASFWCSCSEERTLEVVKSLGREEALSILDESGEIEMNCQFCMQRYSFGRERIEQLFDSPTLH